MWLATNSRDGLDVVISTAPITSTEIPKSFKVSADHCWTAKLCEALSRRGNCTNKIQNAFRKA